MAFWVDSQGRLIVDAQGRPLDCDTCPCGDTSGGTFPNPCCPGGTPLPRTVVATVLDPLNASGIGIDGMQIRLYWNGSPTGPVWITNLGDSYTLGGCTASPRGTPVLMYSHFNIVMDCAPDPITGHSAGRWFFSTPSQGYGSPWDVEVVFACLLTTAIGSAVFPFQYWDCTTAFDLTVSSVYYSPAPGTVHGPFTIHLLGG
jgi:hypothetical protein